MLMLCATTKGWFSGNSALCGIHLLCIRLLCDDHWQRYIVYLTVILYLSIVTICLWFSMLFMGNFSGLLRMWVGGLSSCGCCGSELLRGLVSDLGFSN